VTPHRRCAIVAVSAFCCFFLLKYRLRLRLCTDKGCGDLFFSFSVASSQSQGLRWERGSRGATVDPGMRGAGGVHKGHFHVPAGIVVRGGRLQFICQSALHMSQRSIFSSPRDFDISGTVYHLMETREIFVSRFLTSGIEPLYELRSSGSIPEVRNLEINVSLDSIKILTLWIVTPSLVKAFRAAFYSFLPQLCGHHLVGSFILSTSLDSSTTLDGRTGMVPFLVLHLVRYPGYITTFLGKLDIPCRTNFIRKDSGS